MNSSWLKLSIDVDSSHVEHWSDQFLAHGAICIDVGDACEGAPEEVPIFGEPGEEHVRFWHTNHISALFEPQPNRDWTHWLNSLADKANLPTPHYTLSTVDDQDWVTLTQAQFQPVHISERLWILPSWHTPVQPDAINLIVDPGMAFGTGTHPTTRLCLRWIDQHIKAGHCVLDYGCGSGILAIAATKLGATEATGIDIDPIALTVAQRNATVNDTHIKTGLPQDLPSDMLFDCVIANILANPLRALAPILCQHVAPDGMLLLSGLWREQAEDIANHYLQYGFALSLADSEEGWALLAGYRIPS